MPGCPVRTAPRSMLWATIRLPGARETQEGNDQRMPGLVGLIMWREMLSTGAKEDASSELSIGAVAARLPLKGT